MTIPGPWPLLPSFSMPPRTNQIVPFTYVDGRVYLDKLLAMQQKLNALVDHVNDGFEANDDFFLNLVNGFIETLNTHIAALETQINADNEAFQTELTATVTANVNAIVADVTDALADLQADITTYLNQQITNNDLVTNTLITGPSNTRTTLNSILATFVNDTLNAATFPASKITSGVFDPARIPVTPAATTAISGLVELATTAETTAGTDAVRAVTPAGLAAFELAKRPTRNRMVVVGSSNATAGAANWPEKLAGRLNLTPHIYAIGGSAYTGTNSFTTQVANAAAAMSATERAEVSLFFVCDASNNSRAKTSYGDVYAGAVATYDSVRASFPNARLVVIPQIWPSDTAKYAPTQFPYEQLWNEYALIHADAQRLALEWHSNALFIDESWTWLTGRDEYMTANNDVHPNASGHTIIARMIERALAGEDVTPRTRWSAATPGTGAILGGRGRSLAVRRDGWDVCIDGSARWSISGGGTVGDDIAFVPYGFRPTYNVQVMGTQLGIIGTGPETQVPVEIWPNGAVRVYRIIPQNDGVWFTANYRLG